MLTIHVTRPKANNLGYLLHAKYILELRPQQAAAGTYIPGEAILFENGVSVFLLNLEIFWVKRSPIGPDMSSGMSPEGQRAAMLPVANTPGT